MAKDDHLLPLSGEELLALNTLLHPLKGIALTDIMAVCRNLRETKTVSSTEKAVLRRILDYEETFKLSPHPWLQEQCTQTSKHGELPIDAGTWQLIIASLLIRSGQWMELEQLELDCTPAIRHSSVLSVPLSQIQLLTLYEWRAEDLSAFQSMDQLKVVSFRTPSVCAEELIAALLVLMEKAPNLSEIEIPWVDPKSLIALARHPDIFDLVEAGCAHLPVDEFLLKYTQRQLSKARPEIPKELIPRLLELGSRICRFHTRWIAHFPFREVYCPPGVFWMGTDEKKESLEGMKPRHQVRISHGLWIAQLPISNSIIEFFDKKFPDMSYHPNEVCKQLSWLNSIRISNVLSNYFSLEPAYKMHLLHFTAEELLLKAPGYRMLTEAEWEYAAQWGGKYKYSGSDHFELVAHTFRNRRFEGSIDVVTGEDVVERTQSWPLVKHCLRSATLRANALGIYDMSGLLAEWCNDIHDPEVYAKRATSSAIPTDPVVFPSKYNKVRSGTMTYVVSRGGSSNYWEEAALNIFRRTDFPTDRWNTPNGLRVCRVAEDQ